MRRLGEWIPSVAAGFVFLVFIFSLFVNSSDKYNEKMQKYDQYDFKVVIETGLLTVTELYCHSVEQTESRLFCVVDGAKKYEYSTQYKFHIEAI